MSVFLLLLASSLAAQQKNFLKLYADYFVMRDSLGIGETDLDYTVNFNNIPETAQLKIQKKRVTQLSAQLKQIDVTTLTEPEKLKYRLLYFELQQQHARISLEMQWQRGSKEVPTGGLFALRNHREWYRYYVKQFTGMTISPEEVFRLGEQELRLAQHALEKLRNQLAYANTAAFYNDLQHPRFFSESREEILAGFAKIDSCVRKNLPSLFEGASLPLVKAMEWPGADQNTPPGIYLSKNDNPYGVDVFQYNFATKRYNKRCMEWLYLHEAIPGHHQQHYEERSEQGLFYFGTVEGWACYVELLGEQLGLYKDPYALVGMQEWNLVRSARLVMEVGIHYYGWTAARAMTFWKTNITGQDQIAEREIKRITRWPGQALCYKVGAHAIQKIIAKKKQEGLSLKQAHTFLLQHSGFPLEALL